jgi:hypothetical protein
MDTITIKEDNLLAPKDSEKILRRFGLEPFPCILFNKLEPTNPLKIYFDTWINKIIELDTTIKTTPKDLENLTKAMVNPDFYKNPENWNGYYDVIYENALSYLRYNINLAENLNLELIIDTRDKFSIFLLNFNNIIQVRKVIEKNGFMAVDFNIDEEDVDKNIMVTMGNACHWLFMTLIENFLKQYNIIEKYEGIQKIKFFYDDESINIVINGVKKFITMEEFSIKYKENFNKMTINLKQLHEEKELKEKSNQNNIFNLSDSQNNPI